MVFLTKEGSMDTGLFDEFKIFYFHSVRVMAQKPKAYQALKHALEEVVYGFVEIDEYWNTAYGIVDLLEELLKGSERTIFDGYILEINPDQKGSATSFRFFCTDLLYRIGFFQDFRKERTKLRVVK